MTAAPTVSDLVEAYGSPLYLYELDDAHIAATRLRQSLPEPSTLYYSLKANPHPLIARELHQAGCHAEISSTGELHAASEAGHTNLLYTGPGKTPGEIATAIEYGVTRFSVESLTDYTRAADIAAAHNVTVDCILRLNITGARGGSGLRMTGTPSQFGIDPTTQPLSDFTPRPGARVVGLHYFPITNARDTSSLLHELTGSIHHAAKFRDQLAFPLELVDLGGGFSAPYAQRGTLPDYLELRPRLESELDQHLPGWRDQQPEIAFESGRHLVACSGRLVCTVTDIKHSHGRCYIILDSGINHLGGLAGLGRIMPNPINIEHTYDSNGRPYADGKYEAATVTGPLCTPADLLARNTAIPDLKTGEIVTIPNVGAYGVTASLIAFLGRPVPAEIVLRHGHPVDVSRLQVHRTTLSAPNSIGAVP